MQRNAGEGGSNKGNERNLFAVDRRSYLKLAGTAAGTAGLLSGTAAGAERHGIRFKNTVDMVADAGCDPTGNEPCDEQIREAADNYTLLKFPAGEYKITEKNVILRLTNVGFVGEGDVRFTVPAGFNQKLLVVDRGRGVLFENIDIDLRATDATPGLHLGGEDDIEIHDVEFIGQGIHPDSIPRGNPGYSKGEGAENGNPDVTNAFTPIVRSESGLGRVSNVVAKNDGLMGAYNSGTGRVGVWIGMTTKGTIRLENCQFEGFPNNGLYTSRTPGTVQVEGGVFRNNDITQVRLSSKESYVEGAIISADFDNSDSPNPGDTLNSRGVRFEAGRFGYGGAKVRNCDISIVSTPHASGGVVVAGEGSHHGVYDSRIAVEQDRIQAFHAKAPVGYGSRGPPPEPHTATVKNTSITGGANGTEAVRIEQRDDSVVTGCCVNQTGRDRDGIRLVDSPANSVTDSTVDVGGEQVVPVSCSPTIRNLSTGGSCPRATRGAGAYLPHSLTIESNGGSFSYQFTVSGDLGKSTARGATIDPNDTISGSSASGTGGGGGLDSYGYSGSIFGFELSGDATVYIDGEKINPNQYSDNILSIKGTGPRENYRISVSGDLMKSTANGATIDSPDDISGSTASGYTYGGTDSYSFSGLIKLLDTDGNAEIFLNGEKIDPSDYPDNVLSIVGTGPRTNYDLSVSGDLMKSAANGATIDSPDDISGSTASGYTYGGTDSYVFSGSIESLDLRGNSTVSLNGEKIDPSDYPDNVLSIVGTGPRTNYDLSVSGDLMKSAANGATIDSPDDISGSTASGYTYGGTDSYVFSGSIESLDLRGNSTVSLNGEKIRR